MLWKSLARFGPAAASVLAHVGIVCAIALAPGMAVRTPVLFAELVDPDPLPLPQPPAPRPAPVDRRPLRLPKPIETPMPVAPPPVSRQEPEPPAAAAPPPPAPTPAEPVVGPPAALASATPSAVSGPPAVDVVDRNAGVFASAPAPSQSTNGAASSVAPTSPAPAVASLPTDGITQRAIPQGGYQHRPSYPATARRLGVQGTTLLKVLVADDGRVTDVVVVQSAGHPDLDQAAADAVRRWRFEPARRGSDKVAMWVQLPVEFRLR